MRKNIRGNATNITRFVAKGMVTFTDTLDGKSFGF